MFSFLLLLAAALTASLVEAKYVFAHVVVGNTAAHTLTTWENDIQLASAAGIDAFVLNIASPLPLSAFTPLVEIWRLFSQEASSFVRHYPPGSLSFVDIECFKSHPFPKN